MFSNDVRDHGASGKQLVGTQEAARCCVETCTSTHRDVVIVLHLQRAQVVVLIEPAALQVLVNGQLPNRLRQV